jgi:hypothetical protein
MQIFGKPRNRFRFRQAFRRKVAPTSSCNQVESRIEREGVGA